MSLFGLRGSLPLTRFAQQSRPVVDIRDLATIAWLRTGFENSDKLPISHMLAQCERVLRIRKDVIENASAQVAKYSPEKVEQFELLLQDNRAVNYLMDTARGSSATFDPDADQELLDGMLDAAIKVAVDDSKRQISEKNKTIRDLKKEHDAAVSKWEAEQETLSEERRVADQAIAQKLATLEAARERDRALFAEIHSQRDRVIEKGVRRINLQISLAQFILGSVLAVVGIAASVGVFIDQPPRIASYALKTFSFVGLVLTIQALRGRGVIGLSHISEAIGRKRHLSYCVEKGVPQEIAAKRVVVEHGRLQLIAPTQPLEQIEQLQDDF